MQLTRRQSMTRSYEFAHVRTAGVSHAGRCLVLSAAPLPNPNAISFFGIICTKKVGHAVTRNLLRRRVRELLRKHGAPVATGLQFVVILRNRAKEVPFQTLEKDFLKTLKRLQNLLPSA